MKRQRSRNRKPAGNSNNPNRAYESNGPEGTKVRGNAQTIYEKYQQLARDANSSGDRVLAENHLQHAEHYFRMIRQMQPTRPVSEFVQRDPFSNGFDDYDDEIEADTTEQDVEAADETPSGNDEQPRYDNRDRNERQNRDNGNRNDRHNGERQNRDRNGNRNDRDFRNRDTQNRDGGEQRSFEPRSANNGQRDAEPQFDENGNRLNGERRETRRERYERRRQQRFADQEANVNTPAPSADGEQPYIAPAFIASTQPLGAAPRTPQPDLGPELNFEAPATETPVIKSRAPRRERAPAAAEDASHLPAFLSRPAPVAAEAPAAEEPAKPKRAPRKRKEDAAAEEA